jgi:cation diffusion facilitator family transporter
MTETQRVTILSVIVATFTLVLKFLTYFLTDSISLFSDAVEAFVNIAAAFMALAVMTIISKPADAKHQYGHDKAEYFSSGVEGTLILIAALSIIAASVDRFLHPVPLQQLGIGLMLSILAAFVNFVTSLILIKVSRKYDSITLEAHAKHLMTDVWTTVGIIVGLSIVFFAPPSWQILDPIMAIIVALNIINTGIHFVKRAFDGLMDSALSQQEIDIITATIQKYLPPNALFKALRTRKSGARRFVEFKLMVSGHLSVSASHDLCDQIELAIDNQLNHVSVIIHVEPLP